MAYACRYGKQPLSEVFSLTPDSLRHFTMALSSIVGEESEKKG